MPVDAAELARIVADAGRVARAVRGDLERLRRLSKDDRSPVTVADFAVQGFVAHALLAVSPDIPIVGEERADALREAANRPMLDAVVEAIHHVEPGLSAEQVLDAIDRGCHDATAGTFYALDPIDGTKGFLRGGQFAIALALITRGEVIAGVLGCPVLDPAPDGGVSVSADAGSLFSAGRGAGAWQIAEQSPFSDGATRRRIRTAPPDHPGPVRICESVEAAHSDQHAAHRVADALGRGTAFVRVDSQCKYALVAADRADVYLRLPTRAGYEERIWDHAAGWLVATEAGAVVLDTVGRPLDFSRGITLAANRGILCCRSDLASPLLAALRIDRDPAHAH